MKIATLLITALSLYATNTQAQLGQIANTLINGNKTPIDMSGKAFLDATIHYPVQFDKNNNFTGKVLFPFTQVGINYGIANNMVLGLQGGYFANSSSQARSWINQVIGGDPQTVISKFVTLGAKATYYYKFQNSKRVLIPISVAAGYRFVSNKADSTNNSSSTIINDLINTYDKASKYYFSTTTGLQINLNPSPFDLVGTIGYGYGYGNDIVAGTNSLLASFGIIYKIK